MLVFILIAATTESKPISAISPVGVSVGVEWTNNINSKSLKISIIPDD